MGFFFTLLFTVTAYITPGVIFGPLAPYHVEIVLGILAVLFSVPSLSGSGLLRLPQTYALAGLGVAVVASFVGNGYFGGAPPAFYAFLLPAGAFFLAAVNCRTRRHLQWIAFSMFLCSVFYVIRGSIDLHYHVNPSLYVYGADTLPRLRGLGVVHDPNDFAQVLVSLIPCIFLWRSKRNRLVNVFLVWIPIGILLTGMYLTHSRGSAIALMVVCAIASRRKIGTVPAAILAGLLLVAVLAMGWSGGRDVSMEAGGDRMDAWSVGLELIKAHPLVGVGASRFSDFNYITAHNSVVVCAAEIGIPGLIFWVLFIFSTYRIGLAFFKVQKAAEGELQFQEAGKIPSAAEFWKPKHQVDGQKEINSPSPAPSEIFRNSLPEPAQQMDVDELRRIALIFMISLTGFLTAGWFLSRAYAMWLFLYAGMLCATARMAAENGVTIPRDSPGYLCRWSVIIAAGLLIFVYLLLKFRALTGQ